MIKITYSIFARKDLAPDIVRSRWMDEHGDMVRRFSEKLRLARYVQTLRTPHRLEGVMAASRNQPAQYPFGMAELYWRSREDLEWSFTDADARECYRQLLEDEKRFAERTEWMPWIGAEHVVIDGEVTHE
ncbi:EthD domain-containing protein [Martelella soudanensis]|uniref:EthD domain-containing protein n=1 Tax=unclassified Martelella TaxID=2629616 RepID=UPI0015DE37F0|nr:MULTISPECIES: EthD domain-containing protein [unclassified Martelella]